MVFVAFFVITSSIMYTVLKGEGEYVYIPTVWLFGIAEAGLLYATALMAMSTML